MKKGKTLIDLATEIERQAEQKRDYAANAQAIAISGDAKRLLLTNGETKTYDLLPLAADQICDRMQIGKRYWDILQEQDPQLLAYNVNRRLPQVADRYLVRTLDNKARAFLSPSYRCLDYKPLLETILPVLLAGKFEVASSEVTDTRFYLKVVSPTFTSEIKKGITVRAGFWFRNSEVGHSRLAGGLYTVDCFCDNGAMHENQYGFSQTHKGGRLEFSEAIAEYFTSETRRLDDTAFWNKVKDAVSGMIGSKEGFAAICARIRAASENQMALNDTTKFLDNVQEVFTLNQNESNGVLKHLIQRGDLSQWGLSSALTRYSQDCLDYDRASDFEVLGAKALNLNHRTWESIATA